MEFQGGMKNGPITLNLPDVRNEHTRQESGNVERIETQEKRTRFSLSHDEGISITDTEYDIDYIVVLISFKIAINIR